MPRKRTPRWEWNGGRFRVPDGVQRLAAPVGRALARRGLTDDSAPPTARLPVSGALVQSGPLHAARRRRRPHRRHGDNETRILAADGTISLSLPVPTHAAQLDGSDLVLATGSELRLYDAASG